MSSKLKMITIILFLAILASACGAAGSGKRAWLDEDAAHGLILAYLNSEHPDLSGDVRLSLIELTTNEIWDALNVQVFKNQTDPFLNQTFLITSDQTVLPMGESFGDVGVTELLLVDLNKDEQPELVFTYVFGSGRTWSHLAAYAPDIDRKNILISRLAYMGRLSLEKKSERLVNVRVCGFTVGETALDCPDILGFLTLTHTGENGSLGVTLAPNLPPAITENIAYTE